MTKHEAQVLATVKAIVENRKELMKKSTNSEDKRLLQSKIAAYQDVIFLLTDADYLQCISDVYLNNKF